jgi:hypothetical protein
MAVGGKLRNSMLAGALALAVAVSSATAQPTIRTAPARTHIGVQFHCTWSNYSDARRRGIVAKLAAAGVKTVRMDIAWRSLQPTRPRRVSAWHVRLADRCVNLVRAAGMEVLATLLWTPAWANGGGDGATPPSRVADFAWFARWAARHFRERVSAYEVWNEPDGARFWKGDAAQYVRLLRAAYPAIKAGDRSARVVFAGTTHNNSRWISAAYQAGAKGAFDVMATHPYQGIADQPPEVVGDGGSWWLLTHVAAVHELMVRRGDGRKPIWFTEFGWSVHDNEAEPPPWKRGVTAEAQAAYLVRAIALMRARFPYVARAFWYKDATVAGDDAHEAGFGLLRADLSPRPAYTALKTFLTG